jgi:hypothetical protein
MCESTEPVLASFVGGTVYDTEKVIRGLTAWKRVILLRFNDGSRKCTGTASKSQISCYMDPADWEAAKDAALRSETLRVHGNKGDSINVTTAAWSKQ